MTEHPSEKPVEKQRKRPANPHPLSKAVEFGRLDIFLVGVCCFTGRNLVPDRSFGMSGPWISTIKIIASESLTPSLLVQLPSGVINSSLRWVFSLGCNRKFTAKSLKLKKAP